MPSTHAGAVRARLALVAATAIALAASPSCGSRSELRVPARAPVPSDAFDVVPEAAVDVAVDRPAEVVPDTPPFDCRPDPSVCDDHDACTTDSCRPDGQCAHLAIVCDDGDPCTANQCSAASGCVFPRIECGGCADGVREAFRDRTRYPDVAGCSGGFQVAGLAHPTSPSCGRAAGNDGPNPTGLGCSASDLCAAGWHVCVSAGDVTAHSPDGCRGGADAPAQTFFASRQTGPGCLQCATGTATDCTNNDCRGDCAATAQTTNDIFGCGNVGSVPLPSCNPLDRSGNNLCSALPAPWQCSNGANADVHESEYVTEPGSAAGGVLCCRD